jgi:type II secretory pathway component GspD/PulD (secretin)
VGIEIQFLEVSRKSEYNYGMRLPTQYPIVWINQLLKGNVEAPAGYKNFAIFGGGKTIFGIGLIGPEFYATFTKSDAQTLLQSDIRSTSGQAATYHIGDKYPIITSGYYGDVSDAPPGAQIYTPPPTFNFEDLGILFKITPWVHDRDDISLALEAEYKVLTGASTNGIPVIASRKFVTQVRLRDGEWAVLTGLVTATEVRAFTGLIGISQIPYLGQLFRENTRIDQESEALVAIRPRLLGDPPSETVTRAIWTGTETKPRAGM